MDAILCIISNEAMRYANSCTDGVHQRRTECFFLEGRESEFANGGQSLEVVSPLPLVPNEPWLGPGGRWGGMTVLYSDEMKVVVFLQV